MQLTDLVRYSFSAVSARRMRSGLTALGIAIGIAAVVLLTSMGQGLQRYMINEFSQFGTHLIAVTPGKTSTMGFSGALVNTVRPLSLDDANAIKRLPQVIEAVPLVQGNAQLEAGKRQRRTVVYGVGPGMPEVWQFGIAAGQFLPREDPVSARAFVVLGSKIRDELFPERSPLGEIIRVGSYRFRVIGVMESKGQMLGFDLDDAVYVATSRAMEIFNQESLMEIDVLYRPNADSARVEAAIKAILQARHGSEDFTIITQEQMLKVLTSVLDILTFAVSALGGISLVVGGVGILTIMTIAVRERTAEIGLLTALGADRRQILWLFLGEAIMLAAAGGVLGLLLGWGAILILVSLLPDLPVYASWNYIIMAEILAVVIGVLAGIIPANQAAGMQPVDALRSE